MCSMSAVATVPTNTVPTIMGPYFENAGTYDMGSHVLNTCAFKKPEEYLASIINLNASKFFFFDFVLEKLPKAKKEEIEKELEARSTIDFTADNQDETIVLQMLPLMEEVIAKHVDATQLQSYRSEYESSHPKTLTPAQKAQITDIYTQGSGFDEKLLELLHKEFPNIKALRLAYADRIADKQLEVISKLFGEKLEQLNLDLAYDRSEAGTIRYGHLARDQYPEKIKAITDTGVVTLLKACPKLRELDLSSTKAGVQSIQALASCHNIKYVNLTDLRGDSSSNINKAIEELRISRPDLVIKV